MMSAHLTAAFGDKRLDEITTADVQLFLNERSRLSHKTLKLMLDFMGQVFKDAMEDGCMQTDPTASRKLVIPSTKKTEREAISMEEFQDILGNLEKLQPQDRRLMALMMLTGMRRGEALALQLNDIDWEKGLIHVRRNVTFAGNQPYTIDLHGATPHVFRHSFLTYAQTVVTDIKTLQAIAGHADIQTTMNCYVHQQSDKIVETGKRVTDLFVQKNVQTGKSGKP